MDENMQNEIHIKKDMKIKRKEMLLILSDNLPGKR